MTPQRRSTNPSRVARPLDGADPVRAAYTVLISVSKGGTLSVTLGKRDMDKKLYTFYRVADVRTSDQGGLSLPSWVHMAAEALFDDPETRSL